MNVLMHLVFQIFLWINQLKSFTRDLRESRVWLKLLYFDQLFSRNHLLNKLGNHFIIFIYFIYKSLNEIRDSEICIGFHLSYLDDLTKSEREGNSTGINPLAAYFQHLFVWLILFPRRSCSSQLRWWYHTL